MKATTSSKFFEVTVKFRTINEKGRSKKATRKIIVEASDFGNAEHLTLSAHPDYEITSIKLTKIREVISVTAQCDAATTPMKHHLSEYTYLSVPAKPEHLASPLSTPTCAASTPILNRAQRRRLQREATRKSGCRAPFMPCRPMRRLP